MTDARWLRGGPTAVLVEVAEAGLPVVRWWGVDAPDVREAPASALALTPPQAPGSIDERLALELLPQHAAGFQGEPGLLGRFGDRTGWAPRFATSAVSWRGDGGLLVVADDTASDLRYHGEVAVDPHGVVAVRAAITNVRGLGDPGPGGPDTAAAGGDLDADDASAFPVETDGLGRDAVPDDVDPASVYHLDALRLTLPVPDAAREVATFTGRWIRELHLQRQPWQVGRVERVNRRGRSSHQDPPTVFVGATGFSEERGEVWAAHLAWPGNHELRADRTADGFAYLQLGEHLHPGEIALVPGATYVTPWLYAVPSVTGLNGVSDGFHAHVRARANHPRRPRPVTLNTWEAVYFDQTPERLASLVEVAAEVGVERFVLDDGWFVGRPDDRSGLGDWVVDRVKHPDGLGALADQVRAAGMEFGLWVEPEMVNPDSARFRADPSVVLAQPDTPTSRHQQVLDLTRDDAWADLHAALSAVLDEADPAYVKWDLNRDQVAASHDGRPGSHAQVHSTLRLLHALTEARPDLEIESCASGGGRLDLGILTATHRVWTSDCNDPVERQRIHRGASYLLPPELLGSHVGPPQAHTTARSTMLPFRLATAFLGHFGIEWDLTQAPPYERDRIRDAIALYREWRDVLATGRTVRVDHPDPAALVQAVVGDGRALLSYAQLETSAWARPAAVRCPGLDPDRRYDVRVVAPLTDYTGPQIVAQGWDEASPLVLSGRALDRHGIALHVHQPQTATVLALTAIDADDETEA